MFGGATYHGRPTMTVQAFPEPDPAPSVRFNNRELSWLEFDARVLALAHDDTRPLLERVKFLAIYSQNLDEFFQVRVSGLEEQVEARVTAATPDGMTPDEQLEAIRERVDGMQARAGELFAEELLPALDKERIRLTHWLDLTEGDRSFLGRRFRERIFPVLTPLSVDPAHPFPYISSLSLNVAAVVRDPMTGVRKFARVKVPPNVPRFVELPDGERFVPLEEVIAANLDQLFPGMDLLSHHFFRVTRDADVEVEEDEADDLLAAIETVLRRRQRGATPVRLEIDDTMSAETRQVLMRELEIDESQVYVAEGLLALGDLWFFVGLDRPALKDEPWTPIVPPALVSEEGPADVFDAVRRGDILVHHPYDSFSASVEAFVDQAARDPEVLAIKQTLYRTSADSPDHPIAGTGSGLRQAGRGPGRAEGAVRRTGQHRLRAHAGNRGRPRGVRHGRPEDARQDLPRRAARERRDPPLCAHRHRQLQPAGPHGSTRTWDCSPATRTWAPTSPTCSTC